jgi:O-antigen/teichoic acid export membrane protein
MSLKRRTLTGLKWSGVSQLVRQVSQVATTAVLARLLEPADFGLMGMATIVLGFVLLFQDMGTSAAIVQRKEVSDELLSTVFFANVAFGLAAAALLALAAPLVAAFFREPQLTAMVRVLSLNFVVASASLVHGATLHRRMAFDRLAGIEVGGALVGAAVGIGSALAGQGVWSLVHQSVAQAVWTTVVLWVGSGWHPRLAFSRRALRSVAGFGLDLTGYNLLNYWIRNADDLLIGRFVGAEPLGWYRLAYRLMLYPLENISAAIGKVMFPVYAQIQEDDARFRRFYLRSLEAIALVTTPMMLGVMVVSRPFVLTVFGPRWEPVAVLLMILAPVGMVQALGSTVGSIYLAKGETRLLFRWSLGAGAVVLLAFLIGLRWGVVGITASYAVASLLLFHPSLALPLRLIGLTVGDAWRRLWRTLLCGALMAGAVLGIERGLGDRLSPAATLLVLIAAGALVYVGSSLLFNRRQLVELREAAQARDFDPGKEA